MVGIDLYQWLEHGEYLLREALPIDFLQELHEVLPINYTLIDLLIVFLQLRKHLVDLGLKANF